MQSFQRTSVWIFAIFFGVVLPVFAHQPHDPMLTLAASPNFASDQTLMLGTDYLTISIGVYLPMISKDGGATYTVESDLPNLPASAIRFSPSFSTDNTIFLAGQGGLFRSVNGGANWTLVSPAAAGGFTDVGFGGSSTTVLGLTATGLYESTDGGAAFNLIPGSSSLPGGLTVLAISPSFATDNTLFAGTSSNGIYRSTDGGNTWTNVASGTACPNVTEIEISPAFSTDRNVLASSNGGGVFVSTNGGGTFAASNSGITDLEVTSLALYTHYPTGGIAVITTAKAGVFISSNRGASWTRAASVSRPLSPQTTDHYRKAIVTETASGGGEIIIGMYEGVWSSTDLGKTWMYRDTLPTSEIRQMAISPQFAADHSLIATTYGGGPLLSTNTGSSWTFQDTGLTNSYADPVTFSPNFDTDSRLFMGVLFGLEMSQNAGGAWTLANGVGGAGAYVRGVAVSPNYAVDQTVLIGVGDGQSGNPPTVTYNGKTYPNLGMFLSTDGGNNWIPTNLNQASVLWAAFSPNFATDRIAFAGAGPSYGYGGNSQYNPLYSGVYRSTDGGVSWTRTLYLPHDSLIAHVILSPNFAVDQTVFATTGKSGLYKSTDGGLTWNQLASTTGFTTTSLALSPNYGTDQTLFVGTQQSGFLTSADGGLTLQSKNFGHNLVTGILVSPNFATDKTLIVGCYRGIYLSTDGGSTFQFLKDPSRDEDSRTVTVLAKGSWKTVSDPQASTDSYIKTTTVGDTVTVNFVGSGISWIGLIGPTGGTATAAVDGGTPTTVSLNSATTKYQQTIFSVDGLTCGPHQAVFTAVAGGGGKTNVNLDAIDSLRDGCPY